MKVFIVEDSDIMVERILKKVLSIKGVEVVGISDNEEDAFINIKSSYPDFLIIDIKLKSGDGINLLKRIKKKIPGATIVMLTSYFMPEFIDKCMAIGADYFFDKAKDFDKIENVINNSVLRLEASL
jgi:DNA-binding NarL/FixJ family response regulator